MNLPDKLVSQFAKILKPEPVKKKEETVYGTIVQQDNSLYVQIDGSDYLTPIATTVDALPGERVTIMIKNHSAVVMGNITSPAARTGDVSEMSNTLNNVEQRTRYSTLIDLIHPVGSIYLSVNSISPDALFGGKWERLSDVFLLGSGTYAVGSTGGAATVTLTIDQMPSHDHLERYAEQGNNAADSSYVPAGMKSYSSNVVTGYIKTGTTGGSQPHNNMPPYLVVNIWKRIE